jgi:hypothetical protein
MELLDALPSPQVNWGQVLKYQFSYISRPDPISFISFIPVTGAFAAHVMSLQWGG